MDSLPQELVEIALNFTNFHTDFPTMKVLLFVCRNWYTLMTTKLIGDKPITISGNYCKLGQLMNLFIYNRKIIFGPNGAYLDYSTIGTDKLVNLEEIVLDNVMITFDENWPRFTSLKTVILKNNTQVVSGVYLHNLHQIHALTLDNVDFGIGAFQLYLGTLTELRTLNLINMDDSHFTFESIRKLTNL